MIKIENTPNRMVSIRLSLNEYFRIKKVIDRGITLKQLLLEGASKYEIDSFQYPNTTNDPFLGERW